MKTIKIALFALAGSLVVSCSDLDLSPRDKAASGSWFQTAEQFELNLNALLHHTYWPMERNEWTSGNQTELDMLTDDGQNRNSPGRFLIDGVNSDFPLSVRMWDITYTGINRCNKIITELRKHEGRIEQARYDRIMANARFYRACFYARIMIHFGDPVVVPEDMDMDSEQGRESAYELTRSDMWTVLPDILKEFDDVAPILPVSYGGEIERATRGAAYGMKARFALHFASIRKWDSVERGGFGDDDPAEAEKLFKEARDAAWNCMQLNAYTLHSDFGQLFRNATKHSPEGIFNIPRSKALSNDSKYQYLGGQACTAKLPRLSGAPTCTTCLPSWYLLCAFLDDQGKPIDESPLYDPADPFKNRDPRLAESIVEFGTDFCGVVYDPRFDVSQVWDSNAGRNITNPDNIVTASESRLPSRTGLVQRKGIDKDWTDDYQADPDKIIMRYADVLLMYAEAKIELNEIDDATLEAMNRVRARAYGVQYTETDQYPAIVTRSQSELRTILRTERRMEFAFERLRIYDLLRWRIAEKVLNYSDWTIKYNAGANVLKKVMTDGQWFIPTPAIDESGCPEMDATFSRENRPHITALYNRVFNPEIHYLWPLPATDVLVNKNLEQNYGY